MPTARPFYRKGFSAPSNRSAQAHAQVLLNKVSPSSASLSLPCTGMRAGSGVPSEVVLRSIVPGGIHIKATDFTPICLWAEILEDDPWRGVLGVAIL